MYKNYKNKRRLEITCSYPFLDRYNPQELQDVQTINASSVVNQTSNSNSRACESVKRQSYRVNQLEPTKKIQLYKRNLSIFNIEHQQKISLQAQINGDIQDYLQIKSTFNEQFPTNQISDYKSKSGCQCRQPCLWKLQWTKYHSFKDHSLFNKLKTQKPKEQNYIQIKKDLHRTYGQCTAFKENANFVNMLEEILVSYSVYDIELGYAQGINMIAAILLFHIKSAPETFWALVQLMEEMELRNIYLDKMQRLFFHMKNVETLIKTSMKEVHLQIQKFEIPINCFVSGWLLSLMSNAIPLQQMHLVIFKFKTTGWNYIYRLIISYLEYLKEDLLSAEDESDILIRLSSGWAKIIQSADSIIF